MVQNGTSTLNLTNEKIGFLGGGNMARAIGAVLVQKEILQAKNVWVSARTEATLEFWKKIGVNTTLNNNELVNNCDIIILAVKPQFLDAALGTALRNNTNYTPKLFVSVIVGITIKELRLKIANFWNPQDMSYKVIRTMPNTPLAVSEGITVYCCPPELEGSFDSKVVEAMFSSIGLVEKIDENLMNAVSALSGSGPAYAYLITEALADGAVKNGVPRALATRLAAQILVGAGKMVLQTGKHPGQLKDEVCSPGGTTITGVHALETGGVRVSMMNAIDAAVARANKMMS